MTARYFTLHTKTSDFYAILSDDGGISVGGKIKGCVFISPVKNRVAVLERGTRYTFGKGATFSQLLAEGIL